MAFLQDAPQLAHPYRSDRLLLSLLDRVLPAERRAALDADLDALGDYALMAWQRTGTSTRRKPVLTRWGAWGQRVDRIELTTTWQEGPHLTTRHAILAAGHADHGYARLEELSFQSYLKKTVKQIQMVQNHTIQYIYQWQSQPVCLPDEALRSAFQAQSGEPPVRG